MAFVLEDISLIEEALKKSDIKKDKLLILGNSICHFSYGDLRKRKNLNFLKEKEMRSFVTVKDFAKYLGFEEALTIDANGKADINADLTSDLDDSLLNKFDCVIDSGVLFWCFDPAKVILNIHNSLKDKSLIIHITALTGHFGRGYFNIHPKFFDDFYRINNYKFLISATRTKPTLSFDIPKIIERILGLIGFKPNTSIGLKYNEIYPKTVKLNKIKFGEKPTFPYEPLFIPNNVTSFRAYLKIRKAYPQFPKYLD